MNDNNLRAYAKKIHLVNLYGGKCNRCNELAPYLLEFHHLDMNTKEFGLSSRRDCRISVLIDECSKCELLCVNCHRKVHAIYNKSTYKRLRRLKIRLLEYSGNSCIKCGENEPACLEYHHTDPTSKDFTISDVRCSLFEEIPENIKHELDKCIVLCANCHRKFHHSETYEKYSDIISKKASELVEFSRLSHDEVVRLHVEEGKRVIDISRIFNVNKSTISTILKKYGHGTLLKDKMPDYSEIVRLKNMGISQVEIAKILKCHVVTISNRLSKGY